MITLDKKQSELVELFSKDQIQARIAEMSMKINEEFPTDEDLHVICILKGSAPFTMDLIRHLKMPVQLEFIRLASYGESQKSSGKIKTVDLTLPNMLDRNVLIVEDIVDTGLTAKFILDYVNLQLNAKKTKFATLLDKTCARQYAVRMDYVGFQVDDKFVVGYGLDYKGYFRNLPFIGYFPQ